MHFDTYLQNAHLLKNVQMLHSYCKPIKVTSLFTCQIILLVYRAQSANVPMLHMIPPCTVGCLINVIYHLLVTL